METLKPVLVRWILRGLLAVLALGIVTALTLSGVLRLLDALYLALSAAYGDILASVTVALLSLTPVMLVVLLLWRWQRQLRATLADSEQGSLRRLVRQHPWEAVGTVFVFGFSYRSDPQLSALLLRETLSRLSAHDDDTTP